MQQNMELEVELKKSRTWKPQLELYKNQIAELRLRLGEEAKRAEKTHFECRNMQEKLSAIQREKERLIIERDSLKETNDELKCSQFAGGSCMSGTALLAETTSENTVPPEIRLAIQKILELEKEVQKGGGSGIRQRLADLQGQLQIAQGEKERIISELKERDVSIAEYKQKEAALEGILRQNDAEFRALEETYKKHIEKAKSLIRTLDPK
jgi:chromosome segregation ATPase